MKGKKILSWLLTLALIVSFVPVMFAAEYPDTKGHWAEAPIERWSGYGIVTGDERGFRPNDYMTRAEAATVLAKLFKLQDSAARTAFSDVKADQWYYDAINKCVNAGILNGVGDNKMDPNGTLTRETFFVMFARGLGLKEQSTTKGLPADGSSWSVGLINALTDKGYVQGMDGKVNALVNINRASVMALLDQTIDQYMDKSGEQTLTAGKSGKIALVVANNVTLKGTTASDIVIAKGVNGGTAMLDGVSAPTLLVPADNATVALKNKTEIATTLEVPGKNTTVTYSKNSTIPTGATAGGAGSRIAAEGTVASSGGSGGNGPTEETPEATIKSDLSEKEYTGTLEISKDVGDGTITLTKVTAPRLRVKGGGSNSVKLVDCNIDEIVVDKANGSGTQDTRIELNNTSPKKLSANTGTIIDTAAGSEPVTVGTVTATNAVTLKGAAQVTEASVPDTGTLTLDDTYKGSVGAMTVSGTVDAGGNTAAKVGSITATTGAKIEAKATATAFSTTTVAASGTVSVNAKIDKVDAADGATLTLGAKADVASVAAAGSLTIGGASGDAGKIGTLTVSSTAASAPSAPLITVSAPTATIATVEVTPLKKADGSVDENATKAPVISVAAGTVSSVVAEVAGTEVKAAAESAGVVASVTAKAAVKVDAKAVEQVVVATEERIEVSDTSSENDSKIDFSVTDGQTVKISAANTAVAANIEISAASEISDTSGITITNEATAAVIAVPHVHVWKEDSETPATCTKDGEKTYTCTGCSDTKTVAILAKGHIKDVVTTKSATCTEQGSVTVTCKAAWHDVSKDGDVILSSDPLPIDPTAHGIPVILDWKNAATTPSYEDGALNDENGRHWLECTHNNQHHVMVSAHNWEDVVTVAGDEVTVMHKCSVCGAIGLVTKSSTQTYLTLKENHLVNSLNRDFYNGAVTNANTMTVVLESKKAFIDAAKTTSNWMIAGSAASGLDLTSVSLSGDKKTATLTFTPKDVDANKQDNQYAVSGALRITPTSACFDVVDGVGVTVINDATASTNGYLAAGVPGAPAVANYAASVDRWGVASVTQTVTDGNNNNVEGVTYYYVSGATPAGVMKALVEKSFQMATQEEVEEELAKVNGGAAPEAYESSQTSDANKTQNGKYLIAVKYTYTLGAKRLDGYGISSAINVFGYAPDFLNVSIKASDGSIKVVRSTTATRVQVADNTYQWQANATKTEINSAKLYLIKTKDGKVPTFGFDTLDNKTYVEKMLETKFGKAAADVDALMSADEGGWTTLNGAEKVDEKWNNNNLFIMAIMIDNTGMRGNTADNSSFKDRVAASGIMKVNYVALDGIVDVAIANTNTNVSDDYAVVGARVGSGKTEAGATIAVMIKNGNVVISRANAQALEETLGSETQTALRGTLKAAVTSAKALGVTGLTGRFSDLSGESNLKKLDIGGSLTDDQINARIADFIEDVLKTKNFSSASKFGDLIGESVEIKVNEDTKLAGKYTIKFVADFETALNTQIDGVIDEWNEKTNAAAIGTIDRNGKTVAVTIKDGTKTFGAVLDQLGNALSRAIAAVPADYGTITLTDGNNANNQLTASDRDSILDFVQALKTGTGKTIGAIRTSSSSQISGLNGETCTIKVSSDVEGVDPVTYAINFTMNPS